MLGALTIIPATLATPEVWLPVNLSCKQEDLARGLSMVGRAVAVRSTLPVTSNILLEAGEGRLKLAATNLDIAITSWVDAHIRDNGAITIPARLLSEFVNSLPRETIDLKLNDRTRALNARCRNFEANLKGIDAEEFPPIPSVGPESPITVSSEALRLAIELVAFAAATDDSRPVLAGVSMTFEEDRLTLAAADGFRLAVHSLPLPSTVPTRLSIIVPARALSELGRVLGSDDDDVTINVTPNRSQILFRLLNVQLVSRLIEGNFPNYNQIIPKAHSTRVIVGRDEFLEATKIASYFARDAANIVKLEATPAENGAPGRLKVHASAAEVGDTEGEIDVVVEGDAAHIAFNAKYLSDVLGVVKAPKVIIDVTTPSSPGVLRPEGSEAYTHVIMPMHVAR